MAKELSEEQSNLIDNSLNSNTIEIIGKVQIGDPYCVSFAHWFFRAQHVYEDRVLFFGPFETERYAAKNRENLIELIGN